jgi:hypothetical protein
VESAGLHSLGRPGTGWLIVPPDNPVGGPLPGRPPNFVLASRIAPVDETYYQTRTTGELLGSGFALYRDNMADLLRVASLVAIPAFVLEAVTSLIAGSNNPVLAVALPEFVSVIITVLGTQLVLAATVLKLGRRLVGQDATWLDGWNFGRRRLGMTLRVVLAELGVFLPVMALYLVSLLILSSIPPLAVLFFFGSLVLALAIATSFTVATPVALVERRAGFPSLARSTKLAKGRRLPILGVLAVSGVINFVVGIALESLVVNGMVGSVLPRDEAGVAVAFALSQGVAFMLVAPLISAFVFLLYLDLRTRQVPFTPPELLDSLSLES